MEENIFPFFEYQLLLAIVLLYGEEPHTLSKTYGTRGKNDALWKHRKFTPFCLIWITHMRTWLVELPPTFSSRNSRHHLKFGGRCPALREAAKIFFGPMSPALLFDAIKRPSLIRMIMKSTTTRPQQVITSVRDGWTNTEIVLNMYVVIIDRSFPGGVNGMADSVYFFSTFVVAPSPLCYRECVLRYKCGACTIVIYAFVRIHTQ